MDTAGVTLRGAEATEEAEQRTGSRDGDFSLQSLAVGTHKHAHAHAYAGGHGGGGGVTGSGGAQHQHQHQHHTVVAC